VAAGEKGGEGKGQGEEEEGGGGPHRHPFKTENSNIIKSWIMSQIIANPTVFDVKFSKKSFI
jgi:hypothetical protein